MNFLVIFQVQELGLQTAYMPDQGTYSLLRRFMALPFLPEAMIPSAFRKLKRKATRATLQRFAAYVEKTWITSSVWPPSTWSVYLQSIRMNNDVEGWHNGGSQQKSARKESASLLPILIALLHEESRLTNLQIRMVSERKLCRIQRKPYRQLQSKIFSL